MNKFIASILTRWAGIGNNPTLRFLYGPQGIAPERQDFDGHNACHRCVSETRIKDCRTCAYRKGGQ